MKADLENDGRLAPASFRAAMPDVSGPVVQGTPKEDRAQTIAHLVSTVGNALGHVRTHLESAASTTNQVSRKFNLEHALNHVGECIEHNLKMQNQFRQYWPEIAKALEELEEAVHEPMAWHDGG